MAYQKVVKSSAAEQWTMILLLVQ